MGQKWRQRRSQKSLRSQNHLPKALVPTKDLLHPQSCSPSTLKRAKNVHAGGISQGRIAPAVPKRSISSVAGPCTSFAIRRNLRGSHKLDAPEFVIMHTHSLEKAFPAPQIMTTKTVHGVLLAAFNARRTRSQDRIRRMEADVPTAKIRTTARVSKEIVSISLLATSMLSASSRRRSVATSRTGNANVHQATREMESSAWMEMELSVSQIILELRLQ